MILGLDISTSCTGWCILNDSGTLVAMGSIKLAGSKSVYDKTEMVKKSFSDIKEKHPISHIYVEENLQAYRPGFSSAKTILALAKFNGIVSYVANEIFDCKL